MRPHPPVDGVGFSLRHAEGCAGAVRRWCRAAKAAVGRAESPRRKNGVPHRARRVAAAEAVSAVREANAHLADDPAAAAIFWKGIDGLENLSTEEQKAQFGIMTFNLFKTLEHLHYQWLVGAMDSEVWFGWEWHMRGYLMFTGNRQWYEERRRSFSSKFQEWVDNMEPDTSFIGV